MKILAGMAELVDAQDLKSCVLQRACGFESRSRHKIINTIEVSGLKGCFKKSYLKNPIVFIFCSHAVTSFIFLERNAMYFSKRINRNYYVCFLNSFGRWQLVTLKYRHEDGNSRNVHDLHLC